MVGRIFAAVLIVMVVSVGAYVELLAVGMPPQVVFYSFDPLVSFKREYQPSPAFRLTG